MSIFKPHVKRGAALGGPLALGVIGGGSGHGSPDVYPMSFDDWLQSGVDYDFDNRIDIWDFYL